MRVDRILWYICMIGLFIFEVAHSKGQSLIERWDDPINWFVAFASLVWFLTAKLCDANIHE